MLRSATLVGVVAVAGSLAARADAQANANAVTGADDAFGYRNGDEAVGIYDEASVRGFSLEAAGNYRVNGTYFVRNSGVSAFFLESTTVRIGVSTLNLVLPGPSGVVNYRLRDPVRGEPSAFTAGIDVYSQPYAELHLKHRSADGSASFSVGASRNFELRDVQGGRDGEGLLLAGTARLTVGPVVGRVFGGEYQYERAGLFRVAPGEALPARIRRGRYLGQEWAREEGQRRIAGVLVDAELSSAFEIGATAVMSQEDPSRAFTQLFSLSGRGSTAAASTIAVPQQRSTALSGELRAHWQRTGGDLAQRVDLIFRGRRQRGRIGGAQVVQLGQVPFGERPAPASAPLLNDADARLRDRVDQYGVGLSYRATWRDRIRVNAGVLRTDYSKRFVAADGRGRESRTSPWLYNAGLSWSQSSHVSIYGSYSRGLEEAGVAPSVASNRNEVLEAIVVTQRELGVRYQPAPSFSAVVAGFDTRKPYAGFDGSTGQFRFLGQVRHRGVEASLTGRPAHGLSILLGGVLLDPRLRAPAGAQLGPRPVAVPNLRGIASVDYAIPGVPGLSLDAGLTHVGSRAARSRLSRTSGRQLRVEPMTTLDLGLRYGFKAGGHDLVVRAQLLNVFDQNSWEVNASETLNYSAPRRGRLVFTALF
jgi:iron complex outermembrane recepter protein